MIQRALEALDRLQIAGNEGDDVGTIWIDKWPEEVRTAIESMESENERLKGEVRETIRQWSLTYPITKGEADKLADIVIACFPTEAEGGQG